LPTIQLHIPISEGTIFNFNRQAFEILDAFENIAKEQLRISPVAHADETGINKGAIDFGCTVYPTVFGRFIIPMKKE
jgi:hypothetical protein